MSENLFKNKLQKKRFGKYMDILYCVQLNCFYRKKRKQMLISEIDTVAVSNGCTIVDGTLISM